MLPYDCAYGEIVKFLPKDEAEVQFWDFDRGTSWSWMYPLSSFITAYRMPERFLMNGDEMVEKARAHLVAAGYKETGGGAWLSDGYVLEDPTGEMADFARSAVRDAVRELVAQFSKPHYQGAPLVGDPVTHLLSNIPPHLSEKTIMVDRQWYEETQALASALRKKFEVEG